MEEVSQACSGSSSGMASRGTSVFAGSTRWMAPELIMALMEDDADDAYDAPDSSSPALRPGPQITTMSDVYAFASVCLEVATDELPYPHRMNDHAVLMDIMRNVPPRRKVVPECKVQVARVEEFWRLLEMCWATLPEQRPGMPDVLRLLEQLAQDGRHGEQDSLLSPKQMGCTASRRKRSS